MPRWYDRIERMSGLNWIAAPQNRENWMNKRKECAQFCNRRCIYIFTVSFLSNFHNIFKKLCSYIFLLVCFPRKVKLVSYQHLLSSELCMKILAGNQVFNILYTEGISGNVYKDLVTRPVIATSGYGKQ